MNCMGAVVQVLLAICFLSVCSQAQPCARSFMPAGNTGTVASGSNECVRTQLPQGVCCEIAVQVPNATFFTILIRPFLIVSSDCSLQGVKIKDHTGATLQILCQETKSESEFTLFGSRFTITVNYNSTSGSNFNISYTANFTASTTSTRPTTTTFTTTAITASTRSTATTSDGSAGTNNSFQDMTPTSKALVLGSLVYKYGEHCSSRSNVMQLRIDQQNGGPLHSFAVEFADEIPQLCEFLGARSCVEPNCIDWFNVDAIAMQSDVQTAHSVEGAGSWLLMATFGGALFFLVVSLLYVATGNHRMKVRLFYRGRGLTV